MKISVDGFFANKADIGLRVFFKGALTENRQKLWHRHKPH